MTDHAAPAQAGPEPLARGFLPNIRFDLLSGFLVFLIAMPLCLGIAKASEYPPIAGIWTAVIGGILTTFLSNAQLTIKGPAAGLIVIAEGAVLDLGAEFAGAGASTAEQSAVGYKLALGVGVVAGVIQIVFGLLKAGKLGELVPLTPVHGMLAAIGITIMAKQLFIMFGLASPKGAPIEAIAEIPTAVQTLNPTITAIGTVGLAILIVFPTLKGWVRLLKPVPAQVVVLAVAIPLGLALGLEGMLKDNGEPKFLVPLPNVLDDPSKAFFFPDFRGLATVTGVKYVVLFALIGSIESMLSAQAIDMIDPWRRKTDQNRDLLAVGVANTLCATVGALPMISEIVRSKANIDNGARTKYANMFHGLFLLAFVLVLPSLIRMIPLTALAAMLIFTGFRLASPREFFSTYKIGKEQLLVFVFTIVVTLSTDLLIGVVSGIALKFLMHLYNGAPIGTMLRPQAVLEAPTNAGGPAVVHVHKAAVFSNWLGIRKTIMQAAETNNDVVVDLADTRLVDHSTMEKLHELEKEFASTGKHLTITGLEKHTALSAHPLSARRRGPDTGGPNVSA